MEVMLSEIYYSSVQTYQILIPYKNIHTSHHGKKEFP